MQGAALGGRDWQGILEAYHAVARRELARFCGREIETLEDSLCATFDGPARAVRCGCAISTRAQGLGRQVRVGVNAGELHLVGDRVEGAAVETAKRIATLAGAGEVVVSSTVKDLVSGSGIDLEDHGTRVLPSGSEGWRLFRAVPTGGARKEALSDAYQ